MEAAYLCDVYTGAMRRGEGGSNPASMSPIPSLPSASSRHALQRPFLFPFFLRSPCATGAHSGWWPSTAWDHDSLAEMSVREAGKQKSWREAGARLGVPNTTPTRHTSPCHHPSGQTHLGLHSASQLWPAAGWGHPKPTETAPAVPSRSPRAPGQGPGPRHRPQALRPGPWVLRGPRWG